MLSPRDSTQPGKQCSAATFYRRHLAASAAEGNPIGIGTDNRHPFQSGPIQRQGSRILQQHRSIQTYNIGVTIKELKANVIVSALPDVTAAIVNNNYALDFGLSASDAIFADDRLDIEDYWNLIAARTADLSDPDKVEIFRKVVEAYQSDATLEVFNTECRGFYTPAGWDQDLLPQT